MELENLKKLNKDKLFTICKKNEIKQYSKLKKDDVIALLTDFGLENLVIPKELLDDGKGESKKSKDTAGAKGAAAKGKVKAEPKPRFEPLGKKLDKFITLDSYIDELAKFPEDVADDKISELISEDVAKFINSDTLVDEDYKRYVDKYGAVEAVVEYLNNSKSSALKNMDVNAVYKTIAIYIYKTDKDVANTTVKRFKKHVLSLYKVKPVKKTKEVKEVKKSASKPKGKGKKIEDSEEDEDSDDDDDDDDDVDDVEESDDE